MKNFLKQENEHGVLVLNPGQCHDTVWVRSQFNFTSGLTWDTNWGFALKFPLTTIHSWMKPFIK